MGLIFLRYADHKFVSEGALCLAICAKSVQKARIHFMWDAGIIPDLSRNLIGMCKGCRETAAADIAAHRAAEEKKLIEQRLEVERINRMHAERKAKQAR